MLVMSASIVVLVGAIAMNFLVPVDYAENPYYAVSDTVTAPDPHWLTPEQQQQGIDALQELMQKNQ